MTRTSLAPLMPSLEERTLWLELATRTAQEAGALLRRAQGARVELTASPERDVKLAVDRDSEALIVRRLQATTQFTIMTEEAGVIHGGEERTEWRWIVDPLDGSLNYLRGLPLCCVSIGLWRAEEPVLGAIYDFVHDELFSGLVGQGAWLNGQPIRVSETAERAQAVLATGFPIGTDFSIEALGSFVERLRAYKKLRLLGSAALSLAAVAAGRVDAYSERDIRLWDVAAGIAIVQAAGGSCQRVNGARPATLTVSATNAMLPTLV